jgi:hypothetical protein
VSNMAVYSTAATTAAAPVLTSIPSAPLLPSFAYAGFECATPINRHGQRIDQIAATGHDQRALEDYARLRRHGLLAAREGVRWHLVDRCGRYDFSSVRPLLEAGQSEGIVQIWDLFHYGYPDGLDLFADAFIERFADYCYAVARMIDRRTEGELFFTPVNEISYFAWAAGDHALFAPHACGRSWELKVQLVRAAISGIEAIWAAAPRARIVNVDPICHVVAPRDRPDLAGEAEHYNRHVVYQAWDMLCGYLLPELGGSRRHLDIVGINYYWTNQWEHTRPGLPLEPDDRRCVSLHCLLQHVHERYGGAVLITETSHVGERRADWVRTLFREARLAIVRGVDLQGVCLYPVLGMPEWHEPGLFVPMGLWDLGGEDGLDRIPCDPALAALAEEAGWAK